jgi:hypothetical protein
MASKKVVFLNIHSEHQCELCVNTTLESLIERRDAPECSGVDWTIFRWFTVESVTFTPSFAEAFFSVEINILTNKQFFAGILFSILKANTPSRSKFF